MAPARLKVLAGGRRVLAEGKRRFSLRAVQSGRRAKSGDIAQVVRWIYEFSQNEPDVVAVERARRQFPAFNHVVPDKIGSHESCHEVQHLVADEADTLGKWPYGKPK
ncbi:MAG: hypothetical protein USCAAHI_01235 [Beijerinckiaceae bacterium]|nr:MAG: hypothetical protein USCAAHI_01235 [Beijerinckiaceae bacterium]